MILQFKRKNKVCVRGFNYKLTAMKYISELLKDDNIKSVKLIGDKTEIFYKGVKDAKW